MGSKGRLVIGAVCWLHYLCIEHWQHVNVRLNVLELVIWSGVLIKSNLHLCYNLCGSCMPLQGHASSSICFPPRYLATYKHRPLNLTKVATLPYKSQ